MHVDGLEATKCTCNYDLTHLKFSFEKKKTGSKCTEPGWTRIVLTCNTKVHSPVTESVFRGAHHYVILEAVVSPSGSLVSFRALCFLTYQSSELLLCFLSLIWSSLKPNKNPFSSTTPPPGILLKSLYGYEKQKLRRTRDVFWKGHKPVWGMGTEPWARGREEDSSGDNSSQVPLSSPGRQVGRLLRCLKLRGV